MESVLIAREKIYDHIQDWSACGWTDQATHDEFVMYCVAKDTVQDTAETLLVHRQRGFTKDMYERYFEYYGILQAIYMQQDSIAALYKLFVGQPLDIRNRPNWCRIRELRNATVGHPVGRRRFLNRNAIGYQGVNYSWWPEDSRFPKSETVPLAQLLDAYTNEATDALEHIHAELDRVCRDKHGHP